MIDLFRRTRRRRHDILWLYRKENLVFVVLAVTLLISAVLLCLFGRLDTGVQSCTKPDLQVQSWICVNESEPETKVLAECWMMDPKYDHVRGFVEAYAPDAVWVHQELGILASVSLAQGGEESGWGRYTCGGNNLYGVKGSYDGAANVCASGEYESGQAVTRDSVFKAYPTGRHSFYDHAWTLCGPRYEAVRAATTYQEACWALQEAGYASSPTYAEDLIDIIEDFELYEYDFPPEASRGSGGQAVRDPARELQTALDKLGYDLGPCGIDGIVGPATRAAIKAFQADAGITVDGVAGPETWALLMEV